VDTVSEPRRARSTTNTRTPARASNRAVDAPAARPPMMIASQAPLLTWGRSRGADIDLHIGAVDQYVIDRGTAPGLLDERAQLFR
jgi:hypothetical protein